MSRPEPSVQDLSPVVPANVQKEPMLLLDTTGSMTFGASENADKPERREVVHEAIGRIVEKLAAEDSQAASEKAAGEEAGGLMTITFAGGSAQSIDDLSPDNYKDKWNRINWGGGTQIVPGWQALVDTYMEEFGSRSAGDRPSLLALIITDGEADDTDEFAQEMSKISGATYVCIALLGYGQEHDRALSQYQQIAQTNQNIRVVTFGGETNPDTLADGLLKLMG